MTFAGDDVNLFLPGEQVEMAAEGPWSEGAKFEHASHKRRVKLVDELHAPGLLLCYCVYVHVCYPLIRTRRVHARHHPLYQPDVRPSKAKRVH